MIPAVSYQGAKQRIAGKLLDIMRPSGVFYDLCCGSGSVSIELVNRGYDPHLIRMVDAGPWGLVWNAIARGEFHLYMMQYWCNQVPEKREKVSEFLLELSRQPVDYPNAPYVFLLLQAGSFGGKAIWIKDGRWQNCSFRAFWQPTATSKRRSPVNPMMPMPATLYTRLCDIVSRMDGICADCVLVEHMAAKIGSDATVYIDPQYNGTTGYGHSLNIDAVVSQIHATTFVSEGRALPGASTSHCISAGRAKGGISGTRRIANEEWLSVFTRNMARAAA